MVARTDGDVRLKCGTPKQETVVRARQDGQDGGQTRAMRPGMGETVKQNHKKENAEQSSGATHKCSARPVGVH